MNSYVLPATSYTPAVSFQPDGNLRISGKAKPKKSCIFFKPLFKWLEEYKITPSENTILNLDFEILHVDSLAKIMDICRFLESLSRENHKVTINWHYEEEDEEMKEMADMIAELFRGITVTMMMNKNIPA